MIRPSVYILFFSLAVLPACELDEARSGGSSGGTFYNGTVYNTSDTCDPDDDDELTAQIAGEDLRIEFTGIKETAFNLDSGENTAASLFAGTHTVNVYSNGNSNAVHTTDFDILGDGWYFYFGCENPGGIF